MNKRFSRFFATIMALVMVVTCTGGTTAFAAEPDITIVVADVNSTSTNADNGIMPLAGTETLPLGWYLIQQSFTVINNNLSPVKTVSGRYMTLKFSWKVSSSDQGIGGEVITVRLVDPSSGNYITSSVTSSVSDRTSMQTFEVTFDLGYAGRQIRIFTDVSSNGASNGHYRAADLYNYQTYVYN